MIPTGCSLSSLALRADCQGLSNSIADSSLEERAGCGGYVCIIAEGRQSSWSMPANIAFAGGYVCVAAEQRSWRGCDSTTSGTGSSEENRDIRRDILTGCFAISNFYLIGKMTHSLCNWMWIRRRSGSSDFNHIQAEQNPGIMITCFINNGILTASGTTVLTTASQLLLE